MKIDNASAKEKIFQAALELLDSEVNAGSITTRQIAQKANVNLALINYYYQSKDNLLSQAAGCKMGDIISQVLENSYADADAAGRLKKLLTTTADFSFKHNEIFKIAVAGEMKEGCRNSCTLVIPLLKEIFKDKDEAELRVVALQLMLPFHFIVMYPEKYSGFLGANFFDVEQRTLMINRMTDNIISEAKHNEVNE